MSNTCDHNCASCSQDCAERAQDFKIQPHNKSKIKKIIGVVSGKGGVGKSLVTSLCAVSMRKLGYEVGILDADITGPSIPKAFNIEKKARGNEEGMFPNTSFTGIKVMSINMLLEEDSDPVILRGPMIADLVKQFYSNVMWGDIDYLFVDMPPGTGDVPLTVFQSLPVDGIIVVSSPQELVSLIVEKQVKMAEKMNIPMLGIIENMSYFLCPDNQKKYYIFGESHIEEIALKYGLDILAQLPINPEIATLVDRGQIELYDESYLDTFIQRLVE